MSAISFDMTTPARILVVDDDPGIRSVIGEFLARHGYAVDTAENATAMDRALARDSFDLVVLDLMMPGEDGLSACRRLAGGSGPAVIMLSAMGNDTDRIIGLEVGADDYLPKPCNPRELLARVRAVLRRRHAAQDTRSNSTAYVFAGWALNLVRRDLTSPSGTIVNLSDGEFSMLRAFAEHPQRILSRDQLLEYARGPDSDAFDRAIDVQVSRLRRKLGIDGSEEIIHTVRNEGYMFLPKVTRR